MQRTLFLTKEELATHYFIDKLSQLDVSKKYNVSRSSVYRLQKKYGLEPLEDWERRYPQHLSPVQREVLYGSAIGDDCIYRFATANYASLMVCHALSQKEYAELKFRIWKPLVRKEQLTKVTRSNGIRYVFVTGGHPELEAVRKEVYFGKIKTLSNYILNRLTPISLAFWFQDDGSRCKHGGLAIHTNSFRLDEVQLACKWFFDALKIVCHPQRREDNQYVIFFSNKTSDKFAQIILPWVLPSMRYKLAGVFTKNPQRLHAVPFRLHDLIPKESTEDIV
jgi:transposase